MTFVYFSYDKDIYLLEQSVRSVRRIYKDAKFVVFWEKGKEAHLDGVENKVSSFNRGGNLNGIDCIKGIIDCLLSVNDTVVKMDSDTVLTRPLPTYKNFLFFEGFRAFLGAGLCYAIRRPILAKCKKVLDSYAALPHADYPEDSSISALCNFVSCGTIKLYNGGEWISGYKWDKNWDLIKDKTAVHFGNEDRSMEKTLKKARDAAHMKLFIDFLG